MLRSKCCQRFYGYYSFYGLGARLGFYGFYGFCASIASKASMASMASTPSATSMVFMVSMASSGLIPQISTGLYGVGSRIEAAKQGNLCWKTCDFQSDVVGFGLGFGIWLALAASETHHSDNSDRNTNCPQQPGV